MIIGDGKRKALVFMMVGNDWNIEEKFVEDFEWNEEFGYYNVGDFKSSVEEIFDWFESKGRYSGDSLVGKEMRIIMGNIDEELDVSYEKSSSRTFKDIEEKVWVATATELPPFVWGGSHGEKTVPNVESRLRPFVDWVIGGEEYPLENGENHREIQFIREEVYEQDETDNKTNKRFLNFCNGYRCWMCPYKGKVSKHSDCYEKWKNDGKKRPEHGNFCEHGIPYKVSYSLNLEDVLNPTSEDLNCGWIVEFTKNKRTIEITQKAAGMGLIDELCLAIERRNPDGLSGYNINGWIRWFNSHPYEWLDKEDAERWENFEKED